MKKRLTVEDVEKEIGYIESFLFIGGRLSMNTWSKLISLYHSLHIKLSQMKGEQPIVVHYKTDNII